LVVEPVFYSLVLLPNWPQRPPIVGEEEEEEEEEEEWPKLPDHTLTLRQLGVRCQIYVNELQAR
jgi:hypothetical protein